MKEEKGMTSNFSTRIRR